MTDLWSKLKSTDRPIVLYGMGDGADKMIAALNNIGKTPAAVFASDDFVRGQSFRGMKVLTFTQAKNAFPDMIACVCFGTQIKEVLDNIKNISQLCELYAPDLPVIDSGLFDKDYLQKNIHTAELIYSRLADEQSKLTFESVLRYKLTGNINFLSQCEVEPLEPYSSILRLNDNETYVDLGAYRGDTVSEFLSQVNGFDSIFAVEPDVKNYQKLSDAYRDIAICINAAASDSDGFVTFDTRRGRSSHISQSGKTVPAIAVDSLLGVKAPTFIKLDVEGNEKNAIIGASHTIVQYKPKLCVAAYHRFNDIFEIPLQVLGMRPDYKMYLRHFPYIPAWDTNYYFV